MEDFQNTYWKSFGRGRFMTREVRAGGVILGGDHPVSIQSMTNTPTSDAGATAEQCIRIFRAGADLVRITTRSMAEARTLGEIRKMVIDRGFPGPLVADVHFNPAIAVLAAGLVEKVRINPGNFGPPLSGNRINEIRKRLLPLLDVCERHNTCLRIGVNHGSLSQWMMDRFGDSPEGMVESALEYIRICHVEGFHQLVVSLKSSNTRVMVQANRLLAFRMLKEDLVYPIHLGVTEAGEGEDGRMRSAAGIGALLSEGIGNTVRVSLTEDPEKEIPVARKIIQYAKAEEGAVEKNETIVVDPYEYRRRRSFRLGKIGDDQPPVVILTADVHEDLPGIPVPDYLSPGRSPGRRTSHDLSVSSGTLKENAKMDVPPGAGNPGWFDNIAGTFGFLEFPANRITNEIVASLFPSPGKLLVLSSCEKSSAMKLRRFFGWLDRNAFGDPVILKYSYCLHDLADLQIRLGAEAGPLFLDGLGDGIWLENAGSISYPDLCRAAYNLLQASRSRIFKTEFISCPSCGRTQFNIQETTARIRERTGHLKGLKIAVMGCLVNGPGEMADADYGYVGAGKGKVTLYKKREPVKKNIPAENAVEEMISLIRLHGDWADPR